jgi:hypothetical protein
MKTTGKTNAYAFGRALKLGVSGNFSRVDRQLLPA